MNDWLGLQLLIIRYNLRRKRGNEHFCMIYDGLPVDLYVYLSSFYT